LPIRANQEKDGIKIPRESDARRSNPRRAKKNTVYYAATGNTQRADHTVKRQGTEKLMDNANRPVFIDIFDYTFQAGGPLLLTRKEDL
jgi:hypothetical protein